MAIGTPQELTKYLKQASEFELSVYSQTKAEANARSNLKKPKVTKKAATYKAEKCRVREPKLPEKPSFEPIEKPIMKKAKIDYGFWDSTAFYVLILLIVVFELVGIMVAGIAVGVAGVGVVGAIAVLTLCVLGVVGERTKKRIAQRVRCEERETYNAALAAYNRKVAEAEEKAEAEYSAHMKEYEQALAEYNKEKKRVEKINAERYSLAAAKASEIHSAIVEKNEKVYAEAKSKVNELTTTLKETKAVLNKLYAVDVIFPKYRNMAAMCTMYEYFASGRCTELSGPNGAYNLYESELRQNIIIGQLEKINENLEQIKGNQYVLYQGIMECNKSIQKVSDEVTRMSGTLQKVALSNAALVRSSESIAEHTAAIAQNSEITAHYAKITAYCSRITAQNTEAIKYISLING